MHVWVIVWRFNPLHIWHISLINTSLSKCDKTIIIIWSANIVNENNPLSKDERKKIIESEFGNNLVIDYLDDYESDIEWIKNLKIILDKNNFLEDKISFFWWDLKNDFAIKVINSYIDKFNSEKITFFEKNRLEIPISATEIRKIFKENGNPKKWLWDKTKKIIIKKFLK